MPHHAPKNIVLCSDGTGNQGNKRRGTNVFKLFEALDLHGHEHDADAPRQVAFYDDGVGTESFKPLRILGGAFGVGLGRNVRQLYTELVRVYNPGDRIYLFGFSRGAFTVRTLAGLIVGCGIVDRRKLPDDAALDRAVREAYEAYRMRYAAWLQRILGGPGRATEGRQAFRRRYAPEFEPESKDSGVPIRFVGVWDTVDAVGLPFDEATAFINRFLYRISFPDNKLSRLVETACHALAIDDERRSFHPTLWAHRPTDHDRIEQVWFPGVHSNVGGGYPKHGISLVALDWMMERAEWAGLRFHPGARDAYHGQQNPNDKLYDSRSGGGFVYRYLPRDIHAMCREHEFAPKVHESVANRAVLGTASYAPGNLPANAEVVTTRDPSPETRGELDAWLAALRERIGGGTSFLDLVRGSIRVRHYTHLGFVIGALLTGAFAAWREMSRSGGSFIDAVNRLRSLDGVVGALRDPLLWPWLAALAVLLVTTVTLRGRMATRFSQEWFAIRRALEAPPEEQTPRPAARA